VFCRIASKAMSVPIVYEDEDVVAFNDIKPQAPVHVLIIPKRHIEKLSDISGHDAGIFGKLAMAANIIADRRGVASSGYRLVANCNKDAGQEVFHIHMHLLGGRKMAWPPG
jgi:histidine triad (HIT) family protein